MALLAGAGITAAASDLPLVEAIRNGDKAAIRSLLDQQADVNATQPDGATALAWAAQRDDVETVELLLQAGADVNAANEYGTTPLWIACTNANAGMVEKLLLAGANPNAALQTGETPLMAAATRGSLDVVNSLLAHRVDVNAKENRGGQTALMWAAAEKKPAVVRALLEGGADVHARSNGGFTALLFTAQQGDVDSARELLGAGADLRDATPQDGSVLLVAAASGHDELTAFLTERGADPSVRDSKGYVALHYAASDRNMPESVKALLTHGADPNVRLEMEPPGRRTEDISLVGATPLFLAAESGNAAAVRLLATSGADLNVETNTHITPLLVAAGVGKYQDDRQVTATRDGRLETARLLVEMGTDVNAVGENGWTALHGAAYTGSDGIIELLAENGARLDAVDRFGQTPLSIAEGVITVGLGDDAVRRARNIRLDTAALLLRLGATPLSESGVQVVVRNAE